MTELQLRAMDLKTKLDSTPFIATDPETYPKLGIPRYYYFYGFYRTVERQWNPLTKRHKYVETLVKVDCGFWTREEAEAFMASFKKSSSKTKIPATFVFFNFRHDFPFYRKAIVHEKLLHSAGRYFYAETLGKCKTIDIWNHCGGEPLGTMIDAYKMNIAENNLCGEAIFKTDWQEDMTDDEIAMHCRWDAMATWELAMRKREFYNSLGVDLKLTTSGNAMEIFQRLYMRKEDGTKLCFERNDDDLASKFIQGGYFGGNVGVFYGYRHYVESACYDINGTYPHIMSSNVFPDPMSLEWGSERDCENPRGLWRRRLAKSQGFYEVDVYVPKMNLPPLPVRDSEGRTTSPYGYIHGTWCAEELRFAEECGCKITKCYKYLWYSKSEPYLRDYALWSVNQRDIAKKEFGKGSPQERNFKLAGNGLYGKFGQRVSEFSYVGDADGLSEKYKELEKDGGISIAYDFTSDGVLCTFNSPNKIYSKKSFVEISAMVASFARIRLLRTAMAVEKAGYPLCYCDTDSLKFTTKTGLIYDTDLATIADCIKSVDGLGVGNELGQWEFEGIKTLYYAAPKAVLQKNDQGVVDLTDPKNRLKGVPKRAETHISYETDETGHTFISSIDADFDRPIGFGEKIRRKEYQGDKANPSQWCPDHKHLTLIDRKRVHSGLFSEPIYSPEPGEVAIALPEENKSKELLKGVSGR